MIVLAIIGAGQWGPNLIRNFHDSDRSKVAWIIDRDASRLQGARTRFPEISTSTNVEDALRDPAVEAVVIATPPRSHYGLARAALLHGKHTLVEKPLTSDLRDAIELCELADASNLLLMTGHVFVHNAGVRKVKEYLDDGILGDIYYISMVRTNLGGYSPDVNVIWDLAAHDVSIANYWMGSEPVSASATGAWFINPEIQDTVFSTLRYPRDRLVSVNVSWLNPRKVRQVTLVGDRKMLTWDDMDLVEPIRLYDKWVRSDPSSLAWIDPHMWFRANVRTGSVTIPRVEVGEPLRDECANFLDALEGKQPVRTPGWEGVAVVRALEAIEASMRDHGREVNLLEHQAALMDGTSGCRHDQPDFAR